ncbi:hypothetical protein D3C85_1836730 [compost metagenome]
MIVIAVGVGIGTLCREPVHDDAEDVCANHLKGGEGFLKILASELVRSYNDDYTSDVR